MQTVQNVKLPPSIQHMAILFLKNLNPNIRKKLETASDDARRMFNSVGVDKSRMAVEMWEKLSGESKVALLRAVLTKEVIQIAHDLDADDSVVDFFGWLYVGYANGVSEDELQDLLYNIYRRWKQIQHQNQ
jgi:hypothetical protein